MLEKIKALLQLGRVSNLPTIWTNCIAAWLIAGAGFSRDQWMSFRDLEPLIGGFGRWIQFPLIVPSMLAASLLYIGGTALNDAFDIDFDRHHRKNRPIPSGIFSIYMVWIIGLACLVAGAVSFLFNAQTSGDSWHSALIIGLIGMILFYDWIHKRTVWASVPMGACRFLLYFVVAMAALPDELEADQMIKLFIIGSALFIYIVTLTLAARAESGNEALRISRRSSYLLYLPVVAWGVVQAMSPGTEPQYLTGLIIAAIYVIWTKNAIQVLHDKKKDIGKKRIGVAVGRLLAGICLIDALAVAAVSASFVPALVCVGFFFTALWLQRFIPGT